MTLPWREGGARPIFWQPTVNPLAAGDRTPGAGPLPLGILVPITCSSERARSP